MANSTQFVVTQDGTATRISVHWADLDVARVQSIMEPLVVKAGQIVNFAWLEPVWVVPGMRDVPLPPVTVGRSVQLIPPSGPLVSRT